MNYNKYFNVKLGMQYKIEAKATAKGADTALTIASVGLAVLFVCIGIALICWAV